MKRAIWHGMLSGTAALAGCLVFISLYEYALEINFILYVGYPALLVSCFIPLLMASVADRWMHTRWPRTGEWIMNCLVFLFTFLSILAPLVYKLPLEAEFPEMFPGWAVPMHFFPAMAWFTLKPILRYQNEKTTCSR